MKIIALYKVEQVPKLQAFLQLHTKEHFKIIALRADVESALQASSIKYESGRELRTVNPIHKLQQSEEIMDELVKRMGYWQYKDISFAELHRISIQDYLAKLFYWIDIFLNLSDRYPVQELHIWNDGVRPVKPNILNEFSLLQESAALLVTKQKKIPLQVHRAVSVEKQTLSQRLFLIKRHIFTIFISLVNALVTLSRKRRKKRILVADFWRHTEPYAKYFKDIELIMLERLEFFKIPWQEIFSHRIRFVPVFGDSPKTSTSEIRKSSLSVREVFKTDTNTQDFVEQKTFLNITLAPALSNLLNTAVYQYEQDAHKVESIESLLKKWKPEVVVVRASASQQIHFSLLCQIAKRLRIPSIELQHGLFYLGPGSVPKHSNAEYLATYGPLASAELKEAGYKGTTLDIGSPRFDVYADLPDPDLENNPFTILFVLPDDTTGTWFDSYDVIDLIETVKVLAESDKNIRVILKARPGTPWADFGYNTANKELGMLSNVEVVRDIPLVETMRKTHVVVSVFSTILLESMAASRPVIYWAQKGFHAEVVDIHMEKYTSNQGFIICSSADELSTVCRHLDDVDQYLVFKKEMSIFNQKHFSFSKRDSASEFYRLLNIPDKI